MRRLARTLAVKGEGERRADCEALLASPGDAALIRRGPLRSLLIRCPDGCGETLVVNLDPRAGKAWRLRRTDGETSVYPSVWRDDGCGSHFVVWRDRILWCEPEDADGNVEPEHDSTLDARVWAALRPDHLRHMADLALELDEVEWDVGRACRRLVASGRARDGGRDARDSFEAR